MRKIRERIAESMDLPKDVVMNLPRVSVCGDKEIYIENHKGLLGCSEDVISVKMRDGIINIRGEKLRIVAIDAESIVVNGGFSGVSYEKIGGNLKNVQKNL